MPTLRAHTSFAVPGRRHINEGDLVDASDPIVRGREHLFESSERATVGVEQATAAPGERRNVQRAESTEPHVCNVCGQEAKSPAGLAAHKRSHDED